MHGVCPSKLIVKFYNGGKMTVNFWKTHAGHDEKELRNKHLSTTEKNMVVEKLKSGVPIDRILQDARKLEMPKLERINLLSRKDVTYLSKKYNFDKKRDNDKIHSRGHDRRGSKKKQGNNNQEENEKAGIFSFKKNLKSEDRKKRFPK